MPTFDTPEPISVTLEFVAGDARIVAGERADTFVEVRPSNAARGPDRKAAEQARIEYADGQLLVKVPKPPLWRQHSVGNYGSVEVVIELPAGSRVRGQASLGNFRAVGRLGECRVTTSIGDIELDRTGALELTASVGTIAVQRAEGSVGIGMSSGDVQVGDIVGTAEVKSSNGNTRLGKVSGSVRVVAANGDIAVARAGAGVIAKTSIGDIRIGEIVCGTMELASSVGDVEVGIGTGTAALLDLRTKVGSVRNALEAVENPGPAEETAEVRARVGYGDIIIRRYTEQTDGVAEFHGEAK